MPQKITSVFFPANNTWICVGYYWQVEKIFGPGNQYVTAAKMILQVKIPFLYYFSGSNLFRVVFIMLESRNSKKEEIMNPIIPIGLKFPLILFLFFLLQNSEAMVSIDMPAGPSEVLVIADEHASPVYIAADLLSQVFISHLP